MRNAFAALLFAAACGSAYADQSTGPYGYQPQIAIDVAPTKVRAPYDVQIVREDGETLPTYAARDRFYVEGIAGQRYTIKVSNPTGHRVEAVVTVDGLDAVDGENGDLHKRGYIVPAYGDVRIEGFRTSLSDVATFRFSSVDGSYAGQKGKARNVGVIAVALFEEERAPEQQIVSPRPYNYTDDLEEESGGEATINGVPRHNFKDRDVAKAERKRPAPDAPTSGSMGGGAPASPHVAATKAAPKRTAAADESYEDSEYQPAPPPVEAQHNAPPTYRPGLGTEFGENRYSAANYTQFVRSTTRPVAIAELRYNDTAGLMALGIALQPSPDENEIMTRETADPFPGDRFARPVTR